MIIDDHKVLQIASLLKECFSLVNITSFSYIFSLLSNYNHCAMYISNRSFNLLTLSLIYGKKLAQFLPHPLQKALEADQ